MSAEVRHAWVLNLDADFELAAGPSYAPPRHVRRAIDARIAAVSRALLAPGDCLVDDSTPINAARGWVGRAFCPTPRALALLGRAGATPEPHPTVDVLRRVNSRAFASALGTTLSGAVFATDFETVCAKLLEDPELGPTWRVKHAFGAAGRNQRVIAPGEMSASDAVFLADGVAAGGVQIEPQVSLVQELCIHGRISQSGVVQWGALVSQRCNERGAWLATEPLAIRPSASVTDPILREAIVVGRALVEAGYFGPFGIDAFTYLDRGGQLRVQPRGDINARYSMGFSVGFAAIQSAI